MSPTELYQIADELRAIACLGRHFAKNPYDAESYGRVLAASARLIAVLEQRSPDRPATISGCPLSSSNCAARSLCRILTRLTMLITVNKVRSGVAQSGDQPHRRPLRFTH